jgi:hypothetical protein
MSCQATLSSIHQTTRKTGSLVHPERSMPRYCVAARLALVLASALVKDAQADLEPASAPIPSEVQDGQAYGAPATAPAYEGEQKFFISFVPVAALLSCKCLGWSSCIATWQVVGATGISVHEKSRKFPSGNCCS